VFSWFIVFTGQWGRTESGWASSFQSTEESDLRTGIIHQKEPVLSGEFFNDVNLVKKSENSAIPFFDFRVLHNVHDIERVVRGLGSQITAFQITAALNRLRVLRVPVQHDFLHSLANSVLQKSDVFHSKALAFLWLCFSRLQYQEPEFFDQLAQASMKLNAVEAYKPADISNIVYSIGLLQKSKEQRLKIRLKPIGRGPRIEQVIAFPLQYELLETLIQKTILTNHPARLNEIQIVSSVYGLGLSKFQDLKILEPILQEASTEERLIRYTVGELSNLVYGMVLLGLDKIDPLLRQVIDEITKSERLKQSAEQELSCLMYCLRLLGLKENPALLSRIQQEVIHPYRLMHLTERGLSMMISNLRILGLNDATTFGPLLKEITSDRILNKITSQGLAMALYNYSLSEFRDDQVLEKLVQVAMTPSMVSAFTTNDISNLMYALSAVKYPNVEQLTPLKERLSDPALISRFQPGHVANLFYGSGKLGFSESLPHALDEVTKPENLPNLGPSQVIQIVHGMSQLGLQDQASLDKILDRLIPQTGSLVCNQLANLVSSLGKLGYKDHDRITRIMTEIIKSEKIIQFTASALCLTLHGLASTGFRIGPILGGLLQEIILPSRIQQFSNSQLALMMYSIGKIGIEDQRVIQPMSDEIFKDDRISQMDNQGLTNILYGLSQLEQFDEGVWEKLTTEISTPQRIKNFKALELSLIFYAFGMKKLRKPILNELVLEMKKEERLEEFSTVGLASTLYSLAQLEMNEMEVVEKLVMRFIQEDHLLKATPHHLGNVVYALGLLNYRNKEIMKPLKIEILKEERLSGFSRRALHNLVFGFAQLKYRSEQVLNALWKEVLKLERLVGFTEREWSSIAYSLDQLQFKSEDEVISIRRRILTSRGLEEIKVGYKTELTSEDLRQMRNSKTQKQDSEMNVQIPPVTSNQNSENTDSLSVLKQDMDLGSKYPISKDARYRTEQQPIGPPLHPKDSPRRRSRQQTGSRTRRQVMVFNQSTPDFSDDERDTLPTHLERKTLTQSNRLISPWSSPHYNTRFHNWPTGKTSTKVVDSDFHPNQPTSDSDQDDIQFKDLSKSDPLSDVRHLAGPRERGGMAKKSTLKGMMETHGRHVRKKDNEVIDELVDGLTNFLRKVNK